MGNIGGNVNIAVNGGTVSSIAAGGCASSIPPYKSTTGIVGGSTNVVIGGDAKVLGDVYGGGWSDGEAWRDTVKGETTITLKDNATVGGTLYGGSMGGTGTIEGSKNLNIGTAESAYNGTSAPMKIFCNAAGAGEMCLSRRPPLRSFSFTFVL